MKPKHTCCNRRSFLKAAGLAGLGSMLGPMAESESALGAKKPAADNLPLPKRPFGRTGESVAMLSLGGMFDIPNNQLLLKQAVRWGVTYWDTAHSYGGGNSEKGIGKYFSRFPEDRRRIFLVTKSGAWTLKGMNRHLHASLETMQTDTIDLFFVHGINDIGEMSDDIKRWSEKMKSEGKIRFIGFSTHSNMEECLREASALGWIDGIMMTYNYRLMHTDRMRAAVDACAKAGIGLTAMKTQGGGQVRTHTETELTLAGRFVQKGFTNGQAKLKAVWENPQIASICSQMPNLSLLSANVAAAADQTRLGETDHRLLQQYAAETRSDYCAGCTRICGSALRQAVPVGDVMRCLMYSRSYGDHQRARSEFQDFGPTVHRRLARLDFTEAEKRCPQGLPIGRLLREAVDELS
ncbi:MAG: aldo/keto reductase [Deltaproteobacteria bacterium SG8_13]|nr:MAG: aldo/keto reductase [Deltaproteobacteria bacterium SG8_13]